VSGLCSDSLPGGARETGGGSGIAEAGNKPGRGRAPAWFEPMLPLDRSAA
jgi:hypothetical protein